MSHEVTVSLPDQAYRFLRAAVDSRRYGSADMAVEAGLRALEAEQQRVDDLARLLAEGEDSGDAGVWDLDQFLAEQRDISIGREVA